jgi:hypothetical protein
MVENLELQCIKQASVSNTGPVLFSIIKNEDYFLPFFFNHYRRIGISNFLIYDDHSDEPTLDFLHAQADCTIVGSQARFGDDFGVDNFGVQRRLASFLKEILPDTLLSGRWVLTADADEFLILPSGLADLAQLIGSLERMGQPYLTAPMVDFYGETLDHRNYRRDLSPFLGNPYFDVGPYYFWKDRISPYRLGGGVRFKLLRMLCAKHPDEIAAIYGDHAPAPAAVWKAPLLKHGAGVTRISDHELSVAPQSEVTAALAHFKFYPGLDAKIDDALKVAQYYNRSMEYAFLKAATQLMGGESLITWETRRFEGPSSLERSGLLRGPGG